VLLAVGSQARAYRARIPWGHGPSDADASRGDRRRGAPAATGASTLWMPPGKRRSARTWCARSIVQCAQRLPLTLCLMCTKVHGGLPPYLPTLSRLVTSPTPFFHLCAHRVVTHFRHATFAHAPTCGGHQPARRVPCAAPRAAVMEMTNGWRRAAQRMRHPVARLSRGAQSSMTWPHLLRDVGARANWLPSTQRRGLQHPPPISWETRITHEKPFVR